MGRDISRDEIRRVIRRYPRWYQNIRFGVMLDTRRSPLRSLAKDILRIKKKEDTLRLSLPDLRGKKVIDIGCNAGLYCVYAGERGAAHVLGVDRNAEAIAQARDVVVVFRRLGRSLGDVEFRLVDDVQNHLDLLDDRDVALGCASLYHMGPLGRMMDRIVSSRIHTVIVQGNTARPGARGAAAGATRDLVGEIRNVGGNAIAHMDGMLAFCEAMGFVVRERRFPRHQYPVVVAERKTTGAEPPRESHRR
jgi:SAM-dependent methyltransferase